MRDLVPHRAVPPAPWGRFPLSELSILLGVVLTVAGAILWSDRGLLLVAFGAAMAALGGFEVALREHLAGIRSRVLLLSTSVGAACAVVLVWGGVSLAVAPLPAVAVAAASGFWLHRRFALRIGRW